MKKEKKNNFLLIIGLLLVVAIISVGYATLSAQLTVNGGASLGGATWRVYFSDDPSDINIVSAETNVTATTPPQVNTAQNQITWEVNIPNPGDKYEFTFKVVNEGSIDAVLASKTLPTITDTDIIFFIKEVDPDTGNYGDVTWDGLTLGAGTERTFVVHIEYDRNNASATTLEGNRYFDLDIIMNFAQAS